MGALGPYQIINKLKDVLLAIIVPWLEAREKHRFFQKVLREYLDVMDIEPASTVLIWVVRL